MMVGMGHYRWFLCTHWLETHNNGLHSSVIFEQRGELLRLTCEDTASRYHLPMVTTRLSQWFKIFRRLSISWVLRDSFWLVIVWGGSVAGAYAGVYPERVAGLLLVDPSGDSTQMPIEEVQQYIGALESEAYSNVVGGYWSQILTGSAETTQAKVMQDLRDTPKATVVGVFKELFKYNPVPALERYDGPKLSVITSINETPFSVHNLVSKLPHKIITETGHWLQLDKPEEYNQIMDEFLSSVDNGSHI